MPRVEFREGASESVDWFESESGWNEGEDCWLLIDL